MITTQLVTYIREQQALGRNEETIMKTLVERQWKPQDIKDGFESVGAWNDTFQYVIPGSETKTQAPNIAMQSSAVAESPKSRKVGLMIFLVLALTAAGLAFFLGRSGSLDSEAPASIPSTTSRSTTPVPTETTPPITMPTATPTVSF